MDGSPGSSLGAIPEHRVQSNESMSSRLAALALLIVCPRCQMQAWSWQGDDTGGALVCQSCHTAYPWRDDVLDLGNVNEDPSVAEERAAVRRTERNAALGGISDEFEDLSRAQGDLKEAILALPYGNNSRYYAEPGYFSNVRSAAPAFDFLLEHLGLRVGQRLLDLGADLTWSTHQMARRGVDCCAVDINHHLSVGRLFEAHSGVFYHRVRANMRDVPFRAGLFNVILAMNALHHAERIEPVAANIARMLKRGGRLAFVEPYCATEEAKAAFGRAQIEAGISEQTYLLHEWHRAFVDAGLRLRVMRVSDSFSAVYEKADGADRDVFARFYDGQLSVLDAPSEVAPASVFEVVIALENRGNAAWSSVSQFPVYASYHLSRRAAGGDVLQSFDNVRTYLPSEIGPGQQATFGVKVTAPSEAGEYIAEIDLVHEYVTWFAARRLEPRTVMFRVSEGSP
jgi:2-polyprenyl-3-methyl-5-hydroxy-6-metoxy-1,4-benzoquinol methylase